MQRYYRKNIYIYNITLEASTSLYNTQAIRERKSRERERVKSKNWKEGGGENVSARMETREGIVTRHRIEGGLLENR